MNNRRRKSKIRITALLIIFAFVLIPLLSSNVSALATYSTGSGWTNNTAAGPTGGITMTPTGGSVTDTTPGTLASVVFTFSYTFQDTNPLPGGSTHGVAMTVTPGTTSWTIVYVPTGGTVIGVHSSPMYTNVRGTYYTISVTISCTDNNVPSAGTFFATGVTDCIVN